MPRNYSTTWNRTTNAVSADEFPLVLLQIDHADLITPIRVVNDRTDVTSNGNLYQAYAFNITLPDDPETGIGKAKLTLDNVGKELVTWLEAANFSNPVTVTISQILRSAPNNVEWSVTMDLQNISVDQLTVSGELGFGSFLDVPGVAVVYNKQTAPGLF